MIKTIIFDLAEVYLKGFYGFEDTLAGMLNMNSEEIKDLIYGSEFDFLMEGRISENEFWEILCSKNNWKIDPNQLKEAIRDNFQEIEGTGEIIESLKKKGFKLGLLSDHSKEWIEHCSKEFDYHKLFDSTQYSFEVGVCKTNKRAFELFLDKLGEEAGNCLFIDDNINNINVAKGMGFHTIHFKNPKQLKEELVKLKLL